MKAVQALLGLGLWLLSLSTTQAQPGLKGEYYTGTNFERKVLTRVDRQLNFDWMERGPAPGMPESYYSIRWTGKLLAPATGQYRFYAKVDDGIRIWVGNKKIMDSWQLNDSKNFVTSIGLEAGHYYDLRVDYFNDMLEGEIKLYWQRPDSKQPLLNEFTIPNELITPQYFVQKAPPVTLPNTPTSPANSVTAVPVAASPKVLPQKRLASVEPKQVIKPLPPKKTAVTDTVKTAAVPITKLVPEEAEQLKSGATLILHHVQFEQSSYVLLPESSAELDNVVRAMKANPSWHIAIAGHTDNVGDPRLNKALSEYRAKVVASYLMRHGIVDDRITTGGFGGTRPIADNTRETERGKNRRVEITIN